ncbi:MAG: hypothetical protein JNM51_01875 [Bacteroidia bacterium]|nr:hypothetical protein [Bacteroidia bacterium]
MPQTKVIFILLFLSGLVSVYAQQKISKRQFIADSTKIVKPRLVRPQLKFDSRLVFFNGQKLSISGGDVGVLLKNKLRVTLGYYSLSDKLTSLKKTIDNIEYQGQYNLNYGALNLEFIYKNTRFFSLGMPLEFGFGYNTLNYKSITDNLETDKESGFIAKAYFGLSGTFKPIRWIGLKGAFGYRKILYNQLKNFAFDGVYTSVGLSIDFIEIITDYRMFKLKKRYRKNANAVETAVDLITD